MTIDQAKQYVRAYRRNGNGCYVHAANRHTQVFRTIAGNVVFACHAQQGGNTGPSKTKFCAYLRDAKGKAILTRRFVELVELNLNEIGE